MDNNTVDQSQQAQQRRVLERLEKFSRFTDSSIGIPLTKFRLGADSLIGMLPVVGDVAGLVLAVYVLIEAHRVGAPKALKLRMLRNIGIDFVGGLVPVVGDAFDAIFKANTQNTRLLKNYLEAQLATEPPAPPFPWRTLIGLSVLFALLTGGLVLVF